ncbi:MAG: response regulator transcription factor [Rhodobacteraceae bacterium]|nr:response regulator transcription factor [Paracoccaceae bacterium]
MKILVADDHELVRDTVSAFLAREDDFVLSVCEDLPSAVKLIEKEKPFDMVLLDYSMPGMDGLKGLAAALKANGGGGVAVLSGVASKDIAQDALDMGASGFLPKTMAAASLVNAVRFMAAGEIFAPIKFMTTEIEVDLPAQAKNLTDREMQVLGGLCQGKSNKEIARDIDLQEVTIKLHVKTLCRKLGAKNRTQAALTAKDLGIF